MPIPSFEELEQQRKESTNIPSFEELEARVAPEVVQPQLPKVDIKAEAKRTKRILNNADKLGITLQAATESDRALDGIKPGGIVSYPIKPIDPEPTPLERVRVALPEDYFAPPVADPKDVEAGELITKKNEELVQRYHDTLRRDYVDFWDELQWQVGSMMATMGAGALATLSTASEGAIWDPESVENAAIFLRNAASHPEFERSKGSGWKGYVALVLGNVGPYAGISTAATVYTGTPLGAFGTAFMVEGGNDYLTTLENGGTREEAMTGMMITGTIVGALEAIQIEKLIKFAPTGAGSRAAVAKLAKEKTWKKIIQRQVARAKPITMDFIRLSQWEGITEALQELTTITSESRTNPEAWQEATGRIIGAYGMGATGFTLLGGGKVIATKALGEAAKIDNARAYRAALPETVEPSVARKAAKIFSKDGIEAADLYVTAAENLGEEQADDLLRTPTEVDRVEVELGKYGITKTDVEGLITTIREEEKRLGYYEQPLLDKFRKQLTAREMDELYDLISDEIEAGIYTEEELPEVISSILEANLNLNKAVEPTEVEEVGEPPVTPSIPSDKLGRDDISRMANEFVGSGDMSQSTVERLSRLLTAPQINYIRVATQFHLKSNPGISVGDLAEFLHITFLETIGMSTRDIFPPVTPEDPLTRMVKGEIEESELSGELSDLYDRILYMLGGKSAEDLDLTEETEELVAQILQRYPEDWQYANEDVLSIVESVKAGTLTYAEIRVLNPPFDAGINEGFEAMEKQGFDADLVFTIVDDIYEGKTELNEKAITYLEGIIGSEATSGFIGNITRQFAEEMEKDDVEQDVMEFFQQYQMYQVNKKALGVDANINFWEDTRPPVTPVEDIRPSEVQVFFDRISDIISQLDIEPEKLDSAFEDFVQRAKEEELSFEEIQSLFPIREQGKEIDDSYDELLEGALEAEEQKQIFHEIVASLYNNTLELGEPADDPNSLLTNEGGSGYIDGAFQDEEMANDFLRMLMNRTLGGSSFEVVFREAKRFFLSYSDYQKVRFALNEEEPTSAGDIMRRTVEGLTPEEVVSSIFEVEGKKDFLKRFRKISERVQRAEKTPGRLLTPEEQVLIEKEGWEAFSRSRGYTEEEIEELRKLNEELIPEGLELGFTMDDLADMEREIREKIRGEKVEFTQEDLLRVVTEIEADEELTEIIEKEIEDYGDASDTTKEIIADIAGTDQSSPLFEAVLDAVLGPTVGDFKDIAERKYPPLPEFTQEDLEKMAGEAAEGEEPPLEKGKIRLYRAEGPKPEGAKPDIKEFLGTAFTPIKLHAYDYLEPGSAIIYLDVPAEVMTSPEYEEYRLVDTGTGEVDELHLPAELQEKFGGTKRLYPGQLLEGGELPPLLGEEELKKPLGRMDELTWPIITKMQEVAKAALSAASTGKKFAATLFRGVEKGFGPADYGVHGKGTYFTEVLDIATQFGPSGVYKVILINPFVVDGFSELRSKAADLGVTPEVLARPAEQGTVLTVEGERFSVELTARLKELGHDGIIYRTKGYSEIVVFDVGKSTEEIMPAPKRPSDEIDEEGPAANDRRDAGFIYIPPVTTIGKIEEEHDNIRIERPKKDIGILQKWLLTLGNQAHHSGIPLIAQAGDIMIDMGMRMNNEINAELIAGDHVFKKLPKEYRKNKGEKFFNLMDEHYSPDQIRAADLLQDVKNALMYFKKADQAMRLEAIRIKRRMAIAVFNRMNIEQVHEELKKIDVGLELRDATVAGKKVKKLWDPEADRFLSKSEVIPKLARSAIPDNWGREWSHIFHAFFGQWQLTWREVNPETGETDTHFIGRAETQTEAYQKLADWKVAQEAAGRENVEDLDLVASPDVMLPFDVTRISRKHLFALEAEIAKAADIETESVKLALRGIVGAKANRQKFNASLLYRKGVEGYSKNFWKVWTAEVTQFYRWKYLSEMNRIVEPMIEDVKSMGLPGWSKYLEDTKEYMWGMQRSQASRNLDNALSNIPLIRNYAKPFALERWVGIAKTINYHRHLQTLRFGVVNKLQLVQTLWPVAKEAGLHRGVKLYFSKEGQDLLRRYHVAGTSGKLHEVGMRPMRKFEKFTPAGFSEAGNQGLAFITLYDYATRVLDMEEVKAAKYARLRGQVMTQFAVSPADTPKAMRGPIGGLVLQYKRFTIKNLELVSRLAREGDWGGVTRWTAALLTIGGASTLFGIVTSLPGMGYITYKLYKKLEEEYGEDIAQLIYYGVPSLLGVDLSGSVTPIDVPYGTNVYEKTGNIVFGPTGTTAIKMITDITRSDVAKEIGIIPRGLKSLVDSSASVKQFVFLVKALQRDTSNFDAKQRAMYNLEMWDLWKKAFGFRPETESVQRMQYEAMRSIQDEYDKAVDQVVLSLIEGDQAAAERGIKDWNGMFPEAPISGNTIAARIKSKLMQRELHLTERGFQNLPKNLRVPFTEILEKGEKK